jgi:hypothetical protein
MTTLAMATPSMSKRARSAPKIRSALSTLLPQVKRQFAGDDFDELKICVRSRREEGRVPPPGRDDNGESADEHSGLECAAAARPMSITFRFTIDQRLDRTFQPGLSRVTNDRRALPEPSCYPAGPSCAPNAGRMVRNLARRAEWF